MEKYLYRTIDRVLEEWKQSPTHKPLLLRGARQVGKSSAVKHLALGFKYYAEVNFESQQPVAVFFKNGIDIQRIVSQLSLFLKTPIEPRNTLVFLDEIQLCPEAIMSLRFFYEQMPELHVVAAASLLEFALNDLPTFGVGRIHSVFMYPMTFDEFLLANDEGGLLELKTNATPDSPLTDVFHQKLCNLFRIYAIIGGMPEAVTTWLKTNDLGKVEIVQDDIVVTYNDDFSKYAKRLVPELLRLTISSIAQQVGKKFVFSNVSKDYRSGQIRTALDLLTLAGLVVPVTHTSGNGLPLGADADSQFRKFLFIDSGLMLRILNMDLGDNTHIIQQIMTGDFSQLVNRGGLMEMIAGLELIRYQDNNIRRQMYFWMRAGGKEMAEVDYLMAYRGKVLPVEVKAGVKGGMKSLYSFMDKPMHEKNAVRLSLENFSTYTFEDKRINVVPLYAVSTLFSKQQFV